MNNTLGPTAWRTMMVTAHLSPRRELAKTGGDGDEALAWCARTARRAAGLAWPAVSAEHRVARLRHHAATRAGLYRLRYPAHGPAHRALHVRPAAAGGAGARAVRPVP